MASRMEEESSSGQMGSFTTENGCRASRTGKAFGKAFEETPTLGNGKWAKRTVGVPMFGSMATAMRGNSATVLRMAKEGRILQMAIFT